MDRSTPEVCFAAAQSAMAVGDWDAFFACVAPKSLEQLAAMVLPLVSADATGAFAALCREHGVPVDLLDEVRAAGAAVATSAAASTWDPAAPTAEMLDHSLRHRDLAKAGVVRAATWSVARGHRLTGRPVVSTVDRRYISFAEQ